MKKIALILLSCLLIFTSCTVSEGLVLKDSKRGTSSSDIQVEQFFVDVLEDFGEFLPSSDQSIMDEAMDGFAKQLDNAGATTDVAFKKNGTNSYSLDFAFSDVDTLLKELGATNQSLLRMTDKSITFYVDINNFEELTKIVPFLADPNFEVYGPLYNQGTSEEDYLDMIYYLLGEEGPDAISNGLVTINIKVPGQITDISGAKKTSSPTAEFTFPIIDFLLLNKPLTFTINWR